MLGASLKLCDTELPCPFTVAFLKLNILSCYQLFLSRALSFSSLPSSLIEVGNGGRYESGKEAGRYNSAVLFIGRLQVNLFAN